MDPASCFDFENMHYQSLVAGKGLFTSNQLLFTDPESKQTIIDFANNPDEFEAAFIRISSLAELGIRQENKGNPKKF